MRHRLILKVTKFHLPPTKGLGTVVKNILGGHHAPPPPQCQIGLSRGYSNITSVPTSLKAMKYLISLIKQCCIKPVATLVRERYSVLADQHINFNS